MDHFGRFEDFDDEEVYVRSRQRALKESTRNFVVKFGKDAARIAFDLGEGEFRTLLETGSAIETPVRWINIWGPHNQIDTLKLLGAKYKFSPRLLAVIGTPPPPPEPLVDEKSNRVLRPRTSTGEDIEMAGTSMETSRLSSPAPQPASNNHYTIAKQMVHYQSIDVGSNFLCIGANWMHKRSNDRDNIVNEGRQRPLWSWLVICGDNTVISLHEDVGPLNYAEEVESLRQNTFNVMSQLSELGHFSVDPISMQSVRQTLEVGSAQGDPGVEGASNLFYYLFDDWRAVYSTIASFRERLRILEKEILGDMTRLSSKGPNIKIIPRLHILGRQVRQMQHLYQGYKNLTERVLAAGKAQGEGPHRSLSNMSVNSRGIIVAQSACIRFERLGDRIQLLILSEIEETLQEKDALISTYFNINAQKDSESTARLTRAATLLAKLSVLFLPVSLMTSYFSVQIPDLANSYTGKTYWYTFAVVMSLSFLALFFFSRLLMYVTETLDAYVKTLSMASRDFLFRRKQREAEDNILE